MMETKEIIKDFNFEEVRKHIQFIHKELEEKNKIR
jgi:hypothetical protein